MSFITANAKANAMVNAPVNVTANATVNAVTIPTPNFDSLKRFADENNLKVSMFDRGYTNFANNLEKVFPGMSTYYNLNDHPIPVFANMVKLLIKQGEFGNQTPEKDIIYLIQTVKGSDFTFVNTHNLNKNKSGNVDVVLCEDIKYVEMLEKFMENKLKPSLRSRIFIWDSYHGRYILDHRKMLDKKQDDLIGLDEKFTEVEQDMEACIQFRERLERFGESTGRNYMLYGPPGTGKSSFVRALAMKYNVPIYNVKLSSAGDENSITNMLIPGNNGDEEDHSDNPNKNPYGMFKIVLLEDFDRYLNTHVGSMSAILNALDGILPSFGVLRFFSANNPDSISHNKALQQRMHRTFFFGLPSVTQIIQQIKNVFDHIEPNDYMIKQFATFARAEKLSMRQITHYICQYLSSENPFRDIVHNMRKLVDEMNHFVNFNENEVNDDNTEDFDDEDDDDDETGNSLPKPEPNEEQIDVELYLSPMVTRKRKRTQAQKKDYSKNFKQRLRVKGRW